MAFSKANSPQSAIYYFLWQFTVSSLPPSSRLRLFPRLPLTSVHPSIFPSITCFRRQFLNKMWPVQLTFLFYIFVGYSPPPWLFATFLHFSHIRSNWSSRFFSNITFQKLPCISALLSEVSKFWHHTKLYSYLNTFSFFLTLIPICWWKESSSCWKLLLSWKPWI